MVHQFQIWRTWRRICSVWISKRKIKNWKNWEEMVTNRFALLSRARVPRRWRAFLLLLLLLLPFSATAQLERDPEKELFIKFQAIVWTVTLEKCSRVAKLWSDKCLHVDAVRNRYWRNHAVWRLWRLVSRNWLKEANTIHTDIRFRIIVCGLDPLVIYFQSIV